MLFITPYIFVETVPPNNTQDYLLTVHHSLDTHQHQPRTKQCHTISPHSVHAQYTVMPLSTNGPNVEWITFAEQQTSYNLLSARFSCFTAICRYFILQLLGVSTITKLMAAWSGFGTPTEIFLFSKMSTESGNPTSPLFIGDQGPLWVAKATGAWSSPLTSN